MAAHSRLVQCCLFFLGLMCNFVMLTSCLPRSAPCSVMQHVALLSNCQLSTVPGHLPVNIEELQLDNNHIKVLQNSSLSGYPLLRSLRCASNHLETVEINFFYNSHYIEDLNLSDNNLHIGYQQTGWALHTLVQLRRLDLSGNGLTEEMVSFLLQNMTSLEFLCLSRNILWRLDESTFHDLHQLRELDLERNTLFEIDGAFDGLQKLQHLNLAFNCLPCLIQFQLTQLVVLNASHNAIEWFVSNQDLEETFRLETLDLSANSLLFFPFLPTRSHIRNLLLADNKLSFYEHLEEHTSPNWTTTVKFYNMNSNVSEVSAELWDESLHGGISTLELLDMRGNQVSYLPRGFLGKLSSLQRLRLQRNCLESLDLMTEDLPVSLMELDVSSNRLSLLQVDQSSLSILNGLSHLNLSFNNLHRLPLRFFTSLPSLRSADLSYNRVCICSLEEDSMGTNTSDCVTWRNISSLKQLYLAGCNLDVLPSLAFEGSPLTHLDLSDNPQLHISDDALTSLTETLQHLGLGSTGVDDFDFSRFRHLRSLNISGNFLVQLPDSLMSINLKLLDLRDNMLTAIPLHQASILAQRLQTLFLGGNPFNCCTLDWYERLEETKTLNVEDRTDITCLLFNEAKERLNWPVCGNSITESKWWYLVLFFPVFISGMGIALVFLVTLKPRLLPKVIKKTWRRPTSY